MRRLAISQFLLFALFTSAVVLMPLIPAWSQNTLENYERRYAGEYREKGHASINDPEFFRRLEMAAKSEADYLNSEYLLQLADKIDEWTKIVATAYKLDIIHLDFRFYSELMEFQLRNPELTARAQRLVIQESAILSHIDRIDRQQKMLTLVTNGISLIRAIQEDRTEGRQIFNIRSRTAEELGKFSSSWIRDHGVKWATARGLIRHKRVGGIIAGIGSGTDDLAEALGRIASGKIGEPETWDKFRDGLYAGLIGGIVYYRTGNSMVADVAAELAKGVGRYSTWISADAFAGIWGKFGRVDKSLIDIYAKAQLQRTVADRQNIDEFYNHDWAVLKFLGNGQIKKANAEFGRNESVAATVISTSHGSANSKSKTHLEAPTQPPYIPHPCNAEGGIACAPPTLAALPPAPRPPPSSRGINSATGTLIAPRAGVAIRIQGEEEFDPSNGVLAMRKGAIAAKRSADGKAFFGSSD